MSKVLDYIKNDTVMKKSDIDDMFLELFTDHVNDGELDLETIKIVALKMFLRETCKSNGMLSKTPFSLRRNEALDKFGKYIAEEINEKISITESKARVNLKLKSISE
jgi:hypothetical protein|tara:strand:- start:681 stop:1001 length:321 start_codon:yes stop_codon:yes gene_type:complete